MAVGKALQLVRTGLPVHSYRAHAEAAAIVGGVVLLASLFGIAMRAGGIPLSPANAILLGAMVRWPHLATPAGWAGAVVGYVAADLVTGGGLVETLVLAVANLAGVAAGYFLLMRQDRLDLLLQRPMAVFRLVGILAVAAAVTTALAAIANPLILGKAPFVGIADGFVVEVINYVAIVPVILAMPAGVMQVFDWRNRPDFSGLDYLSLAPAAVLVLSFGVAIYAGGPAALAIPVTALLWCALSYTVFTTAALTLLFAAWTLTALSLGLISGLAETDIRFDPQDASIWSRVAVTLMSLAPLIVASVMAARIDLLDRLGSLVSHDELTDLLTRRAFMEQSQQLLAAAAREGVPVAVLMLDIDHFKKINETHGHAAGDIAMATFASVARGYAREHDLVGRLGGEEFVMLLAGYTPAEAVEVAEHIRQAFAATSINLGDGRRVEGTVSIGLACSAEAPSSVEPLLQTADGALSLAKGGGRNRIVRRDVTMLRAPPPLPGAAASRGWTS